jgi:hypothetical protein
MTRAARFAIAGLATAGVVVIAPLPAGACTCVVRDLKGQIAAASTIFVGTVRTADATATQFDVVHRYKGDDGTVVRVTAPATSCAIPFVVGRPYLVFAQGQRNALSTDLCAGTTDDLSVAAGLAAAGLPSPPRADAPVVPSSHRLASRAIPIAVAALLIAAIAMATVVLARAAARPRPVA